jgi:hypothetical protein
MLTIVLIGSALSATGCQESSKSTRAGTAAASPPSAPMGHKQLVALVAAAAHRDQHRRVVGVVCKKTTKAEEIGLSPCAVTFAGPACQLWIVVDRGGEHQAMPFSEPSEGRRGAYDEASGMSKCL